MGCASSAPIVENEAKVPQAPVTRSDSVKIVDIQHETETAASLVNPNGNSVVFHGLLTGRSRPRLQWEMPECKLPVVQKPALKEDDSAAPSMAYDEKHRTLAISDVIMTVRYTVVVKDTPDREGFVRKVVHDVFDTMHAVVNGWSKDSEITALNTYKPERSFALSEQLAEVFEVVDNLYEITEGRFDPTGGVVKLSLKETLAEAGRPPLPAEISRFRFAVGWPKKVRRKNRDVTKSNANTIIDLDGMSKGYSIDLIVEALHRAGYEEMYVDWGGDIRVVGSHPSGRPWRTALIVPPPLPRLFEHWKDQKLHQVLSEDDIGYFVNLKESYRRLSKRNLQGPTGVAIATSGDYHQMQQYGFHHIVRPQDITPMKASFRSIGSVSILAASCVLADGLATAAMTFESATDCAAFLKGVCAKMPDSVYGYCILARNDNKDNPNLRTDHFEPTQFRQKGKRDLSASSKRLLQTFSKMAASFVGNVDPATLTIARTPGRLTWSDGAVDIDSLTPCSMHPEPLVSFLLPIALSRTCALFSADPEKRAGAGETPKFAYMSAEQDRDTDYDSLEFMLSIQDVVLVEDSAMVIAMIQEARQGRGTSALVEVGRALPSSIPFQKAVIRDDFTHRALVDRAKEAFSQIPSTVCIIVVENVDATRYGLTATSVAIAANNPNLFMFNVMHTSTFFAAFGGEGTRVLVYSLARGAEYMAKAFSQRSIYTEQSKAELHVASIHVIEGNVVHVATAQDHAVLVARIQKITRGGAKSMYPLLWHQRRYRSVDSQAT